MLVLEDLGHRWKKKSMTRVGIGSFLQTVRLISKYVQTELEVAALVFAVEHFKVYLLGSKVANCFYER